MAEFEKVATLSELSDDTGHLVEVGGEPVGLFRVGKDVHAVGALCPHRQGPLSEGEHDDGVVICPWHGWEFDVRTGECLTDPSHRVACYAVKVVGKDVYVAKTQSPEA